MSLSHQDARKGSVIALERTKADVRRKSLTPAGRNAPSLGTNPEKQHRPNGRNGSKTDTKRLGRLVPFRVRLWRPGLAPLNHRIVPAGRGGEGLSSGRWCRHGPDGRADAERFELLTSDCSQGCHELP